MLDPVMHTEISQIEGIFAVAFLQHVGAEIGDKERKGRCKVECGLDSMVEFFERDIFTISGEDA
jgi:hypothetical protein